jgi:monoamine oxidase
MRVLEDRGIRTCVLEARDRVGGRIHTIRDARLPHPIELGAEFIHGSPPEVLEIVHDGRLVAYAVEGERWRSRDGHLSRLDDFWERLQPVTRRLDTRKADRSFAEFLSEAPGGRNAADARTLARAFVEGFHAADAERISTKALADGGIPSDAEERRQLRIADGYDRVPEWLAGEFRDRILTRAVVDRIEWERGGVELSVRHGEGASATTLGARAAIVTVPLGVLLASPRERGAIEFSPRLPNLERVRGCLTMGSVVRVVILFRERWWTERMRSIPRDSSLESMTFLHGDSGDMPVWWSLHPM